MKVELFETYAEKIQRNMVFRVILPDGYNENAEDYYPVLYLQDGQDLLNDEDAVDGKSWGYATYYSKYKRFLPEIIIIAIDCPNNNKERTRLYAPYYKYFDVKGRNFESEIDGKGADYVAWLVGDLKPWIDSKYRTKPGKEYTAIGGSSTGGLTAIYAIMTYPNTFIRVFTISAATYIWFDLLEKTMEESELIDLKYIYIDVGRNDVGRMTQSNEFVLGNQMIYQKFLDLGFDYSQLNFQIFDYDYHEHSCFGRRFPDALRWIFQDI